MKNLLLSLLVSVSAIKGFAAAEEFFTAAGESYYELAQKLKSSGTISGTTLKIFGHAITRPGDSEYKVISSEVMDADHKVPMILRIKLADGGSITLINPYKIDASKLSSGKISFKDANDVIYTNAAGVTKIMTRQADGVNALEIID